MRTNRHRLLSWFSLLLFLALAVIPLHAADPWETINDASHDEPLVAQKRLEALLLEQPSFYPAHFNLGTVLMDSDHEGAATHFETAASSPTPELAHDAWYNLALVRWKQGRLDDALIAAGKALDYDLKNPETIKLRDELRRVTLFRANEARKKAEAEAKKLRLATKELPDAHVGEAYDVHLQAAGGAGGYRFALDQPPPPVTSTPLKAGTTPPAPATPPTPPAPPVTAPPGLTLDADGRLHGTPTKDGRFPLPLVLTDSAHASVQGNVSVQVQPAPAITTSVLPEAILGSPYEAVIDAVGLDHPQWSVTGLPSGIIASTERGPQLRLSGTPTQPGNVMLEVRADDGKRSAMRGGKQPGAAPAIPLTVSDTFAPDLAVLPPATAWAPYTHQLGVRGKAQKYHWSSPGADGLQQDEQGKISGAPEQAGEINLPVTIHAEDGRTRGSLVKIPVNAPPVIEEPQPLQFTVGQPAQRPLKVTGGTPPYVWNLASGVLPKGLRLDPDGTIRGVATAPGETDVTVAVHDRWQANTQQQVHVAVGEKPKDDKKDDKKDDQKDQQQDQQAKKDQQDQQKQDQQKQDQQKQDQKDQKDQKEQQARKDQQDQPKQEPSPNGKDQAQQTAAERTAQQAETLNRAAAERWLESLPKEDRDALMYQLLDGGAVKSRKKDKAW
jgi:Putative Ig domain